MRMAKDDMLRHLLCSASLLVWLTRPADAHDLPFPPEPVLRQALFAADDQRLQGWHALDGQPADHWRVDRDGPAREPDTGKCLHLHYQARAGGSLAGHGLQLDLDRFDASDFDHLQFWIRAEHPGTAPELELQFRRARPGLAGQMDIGSFTVGAIGPNWQKITIPLNYVVGLKDWHELSGLALILPPATPVSGDGGYFIDGLSLIKTGKPGAATGDLVTAVLKQSWEAAQGGEVPARPKLKARLSGWPATPLIDPQALPTEDEAFLRRLAADTWRGIDGLTDHAHGLPLDRVEFQPGSVAPESSHIGDYTNITNIGMHFLAVTAAFELKLITRTQAVERLTTTLNTLQTLDTHRGFFFNYYNTTTLERTSNFVSFVDSSWLTAGLMVARHAFPELAERCTRLIDQGNYRFFFDDRHQLMSHGYYINLGQRSSYHYGVLYAESRLGSLIAIGKGEAPEAHWFRMSRTFPPEFDWQTGQPVKREPRRAGGFTWVGGHYHWHDRDYVPSWGGSLFEALMPMLVLDELQHAPASLGENSRTHTYLHRVYALQDLGYPVWGMSPSSTPGSTAYSEYGVRMLGMAGYKPGVVTPHAAALALLTEPAEAIRNLRRLASDYPVYGDFGFYDAVNPIDRSVAHTYLCLNQAMILVALANHLTDHAVQKHFAADPIIQRVLPLLKIEQFLPAQALPER